MAVCKAWHLGTWSLTSTPSTYPWPVIEDQSQFVYGNTLLSMEKGFRLTMKHLK